ncbi:hypothetical protein F5Y14DRAFT_221498 [Nemania sp. NC0429]|nr:hypothetical protein F5Y14DRAFT_221498 [Nemania sp. NC0429]
MPLQKSFSEQNGSLKTRQRWHKSRSYSGIGRHSAAAAAAAATTTSNPPSRPLERVADATKQKLHAFSFRPPSQEPEGPEPTKQALVDSNTNDSNLAQHDTLLSLPSLPSNAPSDPPSHLSTPVGRLAWRDLIGDPDVRREDEDVSPQEKVGWDTKQKPMYAVSPMPRKRGSKRARSSSPVSSPAAASTSVASAGHVRRLSAALKSPRADPTVDLWDRFSLGGSTATTPLGQTNPALAQVLVSSSPQPSKMPSAGRGEGGLRRTISCGASWPKRRRVERTDTMPIMSVTAEGSPSNNSKSSMVNALLKSVTGELNRSKATRTQLDVLKSPSPRKRRYTPADRLSGSPKRPSSPSKSTSGAVGASRAAPTADNSSDYGDDDFDDDTLMSLDANISTALERQSQAQQSQETAPTKQIAEPDSTEQGQGTRLDEFADMDDDIFADAGDLLSQIDSACNVAQLATASQAPVSASVAPQEPVAGDMPDDPYGDDFGGDFDFEAAEIAATQSSKQSSGSVPYVSISKT